MLFFQEIDTPEVTRNMEVLGVEHVEAGDNLYCLTLMDDVENLEEVQFSLDALNQAFSTMGHPQVLPDAPQEVCDVILGFLPLRAEVTYAGRNGTELRFT